MQPTATFSQKMCSGLDILAQKISKEPKPNSSEQTLGYKDVLFAIHSMTLPLFEAIKGFAEKAGFQGVELFEAWPRGHCQNFVFAVLDSEEKVTEVVLAKNKKYGFLQNGGGKTLAGEDIHASALREAQEEFSFNGTQEQMRYVTIESETSFPSFHFVKGVHIGLMSPEQAGVLKLSDDMKKNEIVRMSIAEFLKATKEDTKPVDHGFDRKWMAKYLEAHNRGAKPEFYRQRGITDSDLELAGKADEWMKQVRVNPQEIALLQKTILDFTNQLKVDGKSGGKWKTESNRTAVKKAAQKVVDALVSRLLPAWTYEAKGKEKVARQVTVQAAQGVLVNGEPVPSFLTIPQVVARQEGLASKKRKVTFEMTGFNQAFNGHAFNIQTKLR